MSQFIETICIKNSKVRNLQLHQMRMATTIRHHFGNNAIIPRLDQMIRTDALNPAVKYKCRILYNPEISHIEYIPYIPKTIRTLKCLVDNDIKYQYKYSDRSALNRLTANTDADDIIIIRNGYITDSSYSNLAFLKNGNWYTPSTPLLNGTCRRRLVGNGVIQEAEIRQEDLPDFEKVKLINAMLDWEEGPEISIKNIIT